VEAALEAAFDERHARDVATLDASEELREGHRRRWRWPPGDPVAGGDEEEQHERGRDEVTWAPKSLW
jgi:hypothetical protein